MIFIKTIGTNNKLEEHFVALHCNIDVHIINFIITQIWQKTGCFLACSRQSYLPQLTMFLGFLASIQLTGNRLIDSGKYLKVPQTIKYYFTFKAT